ncbi:MAG: leucine-rich repeat domain-containing protein, partial [Sulfurovaceae bacterium]|nr:leucine-rich repeat domain-containing protein [Sulfurovaceae bacterium]
MFNSLKNFFHNPKRETINIFEEKTKVSYQPILFNCLEILSLNDCQLSYLEPLSVFINLKILNLSNNNIEDISYLKNLTKLKIVDLRFNNIKNIPSWVFEQNLPIYWERIDETQE